MPSLSKPIRPRKNLFTRFKGSRYSKFIKIKKQSLVKVTEGKPFIFLAMEDIPWRNSIGRHLPFNHAIAAWAFFVEQMCAFRRKGVLYTDVKDEHLLISEDLESARIIDFNSCLMVERTEVYPLDVLNVTPMVSPRELYFNENHTERLFTYAGGMLACSLVYGDANFVNATLERALPKIKKTFVKEGFPEIFTLLQKCLSENPQKRPSNFEDLFSMIQDLHLPTEAYIIWKKLRAPFEKELTKLKFKDPSHTHLRISA